MRIGIMQGRLLPPVENRIQAFPAQRWSEEFPRAEEAGLDGIEWIYEVEGQDVNPLANDEGVAQMQGLAAKYNVQIRSLCADYFMDKPLLRAEPKELQSGMEQLRWLISRCALAGMNRIILPFVDASRIESEEEAKQVTAILNDVLPSAEASNVELHLETSLSPLTFASLLEKILHPLVKVNYDSGNSAALGYDSREEFAAYGSRVGSVHIKDRVRGGGTVPLGTGDANFSALFEELRKVGYAREFILQVARGAAGDEVAWAKQNRAFVEKYRS